MDRALECERNLLEMLRGSVLFRPLSGEQKEEAVKIVRKHVWPEYETVIDVGADSFRDYLEALKEGRMEAADGPESFFAADDDLVFEAQDNIDFQMVGDAKKAVEELAKKFPFLVPTWKGMHEDFGIGETLRDLIACDLMENLREFGVIHEKIKFESANFKCGISVGFNNEEKMAIEALCELYQTGNPFPASLADALSKSGLAFLLESQKHSFEELMSDSESVFLDSVRNEMGSNVSPAIFAVPLRLNIYNAADLFSENGVMLFPARCGFYDSSESSRGGLEIRLERPLHVNRDMILEFHVEGAKNNLGHTIGETGMDEDAWKCEMKKSESPPRPFMGIPVESIAFRQEMVL